MPITIEYLAGLFDGEGSICIARRYSNDERRGRLYLCLLLGNTKQQACQMFHDRFNGWIGLNNPGTKTHKPYYTWQATCLRAANVLKELAPFLVLKRREARIALAFAKHMAATNHRRGLTHEMIALREKFRDRLCSLHANNTRRNSHANSTTPVMHGPN